MSSTVDHVFMAPRPAVPVERPNLPPTTHPSAPAAAPASMGTLPPVGSAPKPVESSFAPARAEPPAPEPAKITELPKPVISEPRSTGTSLPSISNLDAPPQPPKEPAAAVAAPNKPEVAVTAPLNKHEAAPAPAPASALAPMSSLSAPSFPKPVEVKSVPDTPVNTGTPAGGTPRPELDISQELIQKAVPTSVPEAAKPESVNGTTKAPLPAAALGLKRKFEEAESEPAKKAKIDSPKPASNEPASNGPTSNEATASNEKPAEKPTEKPAEKPDEKPADGLKHAPNGATETAEGASAPAPAAPAPKKAGRPKKKKTPAPVGQTQRKTRSQGPVGGAL